jgi:hypothetical protein
VAPLRATNGAQATELQIDGVVAGLVHRAVPFASSVCRGSERHAPPA